MIESLADIVGELLSPSGASGPKDDNAPIHPSARWGIPLTIAATVLALLGGPLLAFVLGK